MNLHRWPWEDDIFSEMMICFRMCRFYIITRCLFVRPEPAARKDYPVRNRDEYRRYDAVQKKLFEINIAARNIAGACLRISMLRTTKILVRRS